MLYLYISEKKKKNSNQKLALRDNVVFKTIISGRAHDHHRIKHILYVHLSYIVSGQPVIQPRWPKSSGEWNDEEESSSRAIGRRAAVKPTSKACRVGTERS